MERFLCVYMWRVYEWSPPLPFTVFSKSRCGIAAFTAIANVMMNKRYKFLFIINFYFIHTTQCYENCTKLFNLRRVCQNYVLVLYLFISFFLTLSRINFLSLLLLSSFFSVPQALYRKKICKLKSKFSLFLFEFDFLLLLCLFVPLYCYHFFLFFFLKNSLKRIHFSFQ